jgi:hypothetical protein
MKENHITFNESKTLKYIDLLNKVETFGNITMEASVVNYNPMLGLVYLDIHPYDRDKAFGDDDENYENSFHVKVYKELTNWGKTKISKENNKFLFNISDKGDFGPNTNGLGINGVKILSYPSPIKKEKKKINNDLIPILVLLGVCLISYIVFKATFN